MKIRTKAVFKILSLAIINLNIFACGNSNSAGEENPFQETNPNLSQAAVESYITFDVLGGIFEKSSDVESVIIKPNFNRVQEASVGKLSVNLPPPEKNSDTSSLNKPFTIDSSFSFVGKNRSGKLIFSIKGEGEEKVVSNKIIRHFSSLTFRFLFLRYAFENVCLGAIHLYGEIQCDIEGDYDLTKKHFSGKSHCRHGPLSAPSTLTYTTKDKTYQVGLDANLTIDGDPFNFGSYTYSGEVEIDGAKKKIEELTQDLNACS